MEKLTLTETPTCACGSVSVAVDGRALSMLLCSCRDCRKATGTGHSGFVIMRRDDVTVSGETRHFTKIANSGSEISRHFCPICGTPVYGVTARSPALILLPVGLFTEPDWFVPTQAIFSRSHLVWDALPEGIAQYETYRPGAEG
ncbi:GFA family protein [Pelagibacterium limicola]|uniref:GFA family protein n=1 Tax=Pelagibacterium limicola TaxID=2791022 RepID=UPI0018AFDBC2|nr:GFA family protein [Pelagibacterium limicola]